MARPDGVALTPAGGCTVDRISRTTAARRCSSLGPVRKIRFNAFPLLLTVDFWTPGGATALAARTSSPVGATWVAPGTSFVMSLTVVTMPAAVSSVSGCSASCLVVKPSMNVTVLSSNTSLDCTNIPSSLDDPVSRSSVLRS